MIAEFFRKHPLLGIHLVIVLLILVGLIQRTGIMYAHWIAIYLLALVAGYGGLHRIIHLVPCKDRHSRDPRPLAIAVLVATVCVAVGHWTLLGHVPLIAALRQQDNLLVQEIRLHMTLDIPSWLNYLSNFLIKALIPFTLVVTFGRRPVLFAAVAFAGAVYALSLVQKSYIITLFVPLWIAFLLARRWIGFAALTAGFILATGLLFLVAKPEKLVQAASNGEVANAPVVDEGVKERGLVGDLFWSVTRRVLLMPGWTVAAWFEHIPSDIPFQKGAAVRPLAAVLGKDYVALDRSIYDLEYPEYAAKGTQGTMGSASFMYGWANFGWLGLALSGFITALVLRGSTLAFAGRWQWAISLSTFPLLALSSAALPTILLTHGWAIILVLFTCFTPPHEPLR